MHNEECLNISVPLQEINVIKEDNNEHSRSDSWSCIPAQESALSLTYENIVCLPSSGVSCCIRELFPRHCLPS